MIPPSASKSRGTGNRSSPTNNFRGNRSRTPTTSTSRVNTGNKPSTSSNSRVNTGNKPSTSSNSKVNTGNKPSTSSNSKVNTGNKTSTSSNSKVNTGNKPSTSSNSKVNTGNKPSTASNSKVNNGNKPSTASNSRFNNGNRPTATTRNSDKIYRNGISYTAEENGYGDIDITVQNKSKKLQKGDITFQNLSMSNTINYNLRPGTSSTHTIPIETYSRTGHSLASGQSSRTKIRQNKANNVNVLTENFEWWK